MATSPNVTPRPSISEGSGIDRNHNDVQRRDDHAQSGTRANGSRTGVLKPIGIINEQNTCFLNSTFQALCATVPLITLLSTAPTSHQPAFNNSTLPSPTFPPSRIPSLLPDVSEPPLYNLLPVTRTFTASLQKALKMKDALGGTTGPSEESSSRCMSLRALLREMAKKYDQYDDYMQQDAHELLRHLLDSMEMEEKDVIKKVQPGNNGVINGKKKRKGKGMDGISPMPSPLASPAVSAPGSPTKEGFGEILTARPGGDVGGMPREVPEDERLVPFVDVLFGGSLASIVICEHCKSVSHTYEGFLDISLSLKGDDPKPRKRDRIKAAFGLGLKRGSISKTKDNALSDTEYSDTETKANEREQDRRKSLDTDDRPSSDGLVARSGSSSKLSGLKAKTSFSFRKKTSKPTTNSSTGSLPALDSHNQPPVHTSHVPASPISIASHGSHSYSSHGIGHGSSGPTKAQAAYISRILASAQGPETDPLAKLRAANGGAGGHVDGGVVGVPVETGLVESLRAFTSVEVLEGENAFACRKCWRVKTGKWKNENATLREEDEEALDVTSPSVSPLMMPHRAPPPSISIVGSDTTSDRSLSIPETENSRLGRAESTTSRSSAASHISRAPSPLRRQVANSEHSTSTSLSSDPGHSTEVESNIERVDPDSDGLSDTSSDEEPPAPDVNVVGRPRMPPRRNSSHFVMRRAFKRYLIAKAPEVLVFHFKRFKSTQKTSLAFTSFYDLKKMDDFVAFPEMLDLAPFMAPNRNDYKLSAGPGGGMRAPYMDWTSPAEGPELQPVMYRLYAVVIHLGTMIGGHYVAYCLVDPDQMFSGVPTGDIGGLSIGDGGTKKDKRVWCFCSDTSIRLASVEEVLSSRAYLCFGCITGCRSIILLHRAKSMDLMQGSDIYRGGVIQQRVWVGERIYPSKPPEVLSSVSHLPSEFEAETSTFLVESGFCSNISRMTSSASTATAPTQATTSVAISKLLASCLLKFSVETTRKRNESSMSESLQKFTTVGQTITLELTLGELAGLRYLTRVWERKMIEPQNFLAFERGLARTPRSFMGLDHTTLLSDINSIGRSTSDLEATIKSKKEAEESARIAALPPIDRDRAKNKRQARTRSRHRSSGVTRSFTPRPSSTARSSSGRMADEGVDETAQSLSHLSRVIAAIKSHFSSRSVSDSASTSEQRLLIIAPM